MHSIEDMLVEKNYSKCPLKKRPINYQFDETTTTTTAAPSAKDNKLEALQTLTTPEQPENLSLKKNYTESSKNSEKHREPVTATPAQLIKKEDLINVSDCCEDEGVDVDHTDSDEDEEMINCVDIEENHDQDGNQTQAAALAAAAAVAAAQAAAVVVPTPTYPAYGLQPWNFPMSQYTAEFYRTINNQHLAQQISPLRGELLSPSSPSDSIGSLSPPPHYLHGRASSVSPPMRAEIIHRPIGMRQAAQSHRFMPYQLPAAAYHGQLTQQGSTYANLSGYHPTPLSHHTQHQHAPISPAYSETSYYSMRSLTPESNCSSVPEDLSIKQHSSSQKSAKPEKIAEFPALSPAASSITCSSNSSISTTPSTKKDKSQPPRYQCPDCQKSYSTFSGLTKHQQFHCPAAEGNQVKKSFSCKDCDKTYVSLGALKMHIRTHTLPCKCNICGKAFSRPWLLQGHIRTHTGEKPFSCQHCHRAFADRSNLRAHLQTHSDIKKYSCGNCSKTFSRMSLLTKHSEGGCPGSNGSSSSSGGGGGSSVSTAMELSNSSYEVYAEH